MPDVMADRRDAPRYPLILMAEVTDLATRIKMTARTSDVSRTGCFLDMLNPLPKGSQVHLRLVRGGESLETEAQVVYCKQSLGIGVRFFEYLKEAQLAVLDRWLSEAAKNL